MKPVFTKALVLALLLAVVPSISGAVPDSATWQSSVVGTNVLMVVNGTLTVNDFPVSSDNSLIGLFVPTLQSQAVGVYALSGGTGGFSVNVYGNTGATSQNGAISGEHLDFYFHDNVGGLTVATIDPGITYAGTEGTPFIYPSSVSLRAYFPPVITAFDNSGAVGTHVLLNGVNFSAIKAGNQVLFNGVPATVDNVLDGNRLLVTVPGGAQSGPVSIQTSGGFFATSSDFTVKPRIGSFTPSSGVRGDVVTVTGNNFGGAPSLFVAGTAVSGTVVSVVNDNQFTFAIPADVVSGALSVTTSGGTGTGSGTLTVFPSVTGISPLTGGVGDVVTISGYNFDNTSAGATQVTFSGNASATIDPAGSSRTVLAVRVPGGALDGPISVATSAGPATSVDSFSITTRHFADPVPTPWSMTLSGSVKKNGVASPAGDEIAVYSVHPKPLVAGKWEKVLVAHATILSDGTLSAMPVYGDDPATTGNTEGCVAGEETLLALWSVSDSKTYYAVLDGTSGLPVSIAWDNASVIPPVDLNFVEGQRIPLRTGGTGAWNLVSAGVLKGVLASGGTASSRQLAGATYDNVASMDLSVPLKSIEGKFDRILGNDGSGVKTWDPTRPTFSTLKALQPGYGYWIKAKASARPLVWMTFPGLMARGDETLDVNTGWTLLGYWANERVYQDNTVTGSLLPVSATDNVVVANVGEVWASITGNYDRVIAFDGGAKSWNPALPTFSTMKYLGPGYGYWIKMRSNQALGYPAGTR